jgi:hypothetical protein
MAHPKFGERYTCFHCGVKFYDMQKPDPICPKCSLDQRKAPKKPSGKSSAKHITYKDYDNEVDNDFDDDAVETEVPGGESLEDPLVDEVDEEY